MPPSAVSSRLMKRVQPPPDIDLWEMYQVGDTVEVHVRSVDEKGLYWGVLMFDRLNPKDQQYSAAIKRVVVGASLKIELISIDE
jgi:hypothetical protein